VRRVHGDVQPAARRSVLNYGMATELRQRGFACTRWAVVRVQEGPTRAPPTSTRPAHAPLRGRALLPLGCVARTPAMACGVGVHLAGHGGGERLRRQNEPADPSDDGLEASGRRVAGGGLGQRGAPRPGRPALSAQASADRPARRPRRCASIGRRRTRPRAPSDCRRARTGSRRCARRQCGASTARRTSRRGRARRTVRVAFVGPGYISKYKFRF
jgi:hypothetical protein